MLNMKKTIFILSLIACLILLGVTGCAGNSENYVSNFENFIVKTENSEYASDVDKIDMILTNNSDKEIYYLPDFFLEKKTDGKWEEVKKDNEVGSDIICALKSGASNDEKIYVNDCYDLLSSGEYRVVVKVADSADDINAKPSMVYGEFIIK